MNALEFDELFEETVAKRLTNEGFRREGKSLYMADGVCQFGWIRGGGRLSQAGMLAHVVVFRHSCLRGKSGEVHKSAPHAAGDYPWILSGEDHSEGQPSDQLNVAQRSAAPRPVFVARRARYARMQRCIACRCNAAQLARLSLRQLR